MEETVICRALLEKQGAGKHLILWDQTHGRRKRGRPAKTYIKLLEKDTHMSTEELKTEMEDRDDWRRFFKLSRVNSEEVSK